MARNCSARPQPGQSLVGPARAPEGAGRTALKTREEIRGPRENPFGHLVWEGVSGNEDGGPHTRTEVGQRSSERDGRHPEPGSGLGCGAPAPHTAGPSDQSAPQREGNPPATPHLLRPRAPVSKRAGMASLQHTGQHVSPRRSRSRRAITRKCSMLTLCFPDAWQVGVSALPFLEPSLSRREPLRCPQRRGHAGLVPSQRRKRPFQSGAQPCAQPGERAGRACPRRLLRRAAGPRTVPATGPAGPGASGPQGQALCTRSGSFSGRAPPGAAGKQLPAARAVSCLG